MSSEESFTETHLGDILNAALHGTYLMRKAVMGKRLTERPDVYHIICHIQIPPNMHTQEDRRQ